MNLHELKDALFARGAALGFTDMELYYQSNAKFSGKVFKAEIETYAIAVDGGLSFRGRYGGTMGTAYTELIDESAIDALLTGARASAEVIDSEETEPLYAGPFEYETVDLFSESLDRATPDQYVEALKALEAECFRLDPRIALLQYCNAEAISAERMIANTRGLQRSEKGNVAFIYASIVAREGSDTKSSLRIRPISNLATFDPKVMAREMVDEVTSYLGAEPVESGSYQILLQNTAAADLLSTFEDVFFASNVQKGRSLLKGRVGECIASPLLTLIDDPFMPGAAASRSFDSEGVPSRRLNLVEKGVLTTFLYNLKTAGVDGVASTGHGYKRSYKGAIAVAPSNLYVQPGERSCGEMVAATKEAVMITSLQGLHSGANPISGDFSLAAHGYYVKDGKLIRPVNQITVAGNFFTVLKEIEEVGADLEFGIPSGGNVGSPTLRVKSLAVAGR